MTLPDCIVYGFSAAALVTSFVYSRWDKYRNGDCPERQPIGSGDFEFLAVDGDRMEVRR